MRGDRSGQASVGVAPNAPAAATASFAEVYRAHFRFVWRTLGRLGVREADLLDVTQNVFLVVHRQLAAFEGRSELTTWLFSICRLVVKDYLRSASIRLEVLVDVGELSKRAGTSESPLRRLDSEDLGRMLESVLDKLPEKLRVAFVLFELEEMSGEDIARLLDVPVGTVRSRLRLAREAFQREVKLLGATGETEDGTAESLSPAVPRLGRA
jgi:RNA polymerase sigma-70 factor (ECF subfamily)